jgi:hypothetical protein
MLDVFTAAFRLEPPGQAAGVTWADERLAGAAGYRELAGAFAGCSFEQGLYRVHDGVTGPLALSWVTSYFPQFAGRACPFSQDWLGRQFAVDYGRLEDGEPLVLLFEPGTGEVLEIPFSFTRFHEQLDALREPALAASFFAAWTGTRPGVLPLDARHCAGYKVPLFLGGSDSAENLEIVDLDVYWSVSAQLRHGTRVLPPGSSIGQVGRG